MTTYRERRLAKAERLRGWAATNETKAGAARAGAERLADSIPFGQPILVGHHSEGRARRDHDRISGGFEKSFELAAKAGAQESRAASIEAQAASAVYSDDPDAIEQLEAKIATLEQKRDRIKAYNALRRKRKSDEGVAEDIAAAGLTAGETAGLLSALQFQPYACKHGAFPGYELTNLGSTIRQKKQRIEQISATTAATEAGERVGGRGMTSRYAGECADCGGAIERGEQIIWYRSTSEATHATCPVAA